MDITGISSSLQSTMPVSQNATDDYEKNIQQQIARLQDQIKSLDSDVELTNEQKMNEKQKLQEQIQNLNKQLRQHQLEKQQEQAEKKQAEARQAAENSDSVVQDTDISAGLSKAESGVIITLSETDRQIEHLRGIRNDLQAKLRTAETPEVKKKLQERINHISSNMGKTIKKTTDTISEYRSLDPDNEDKFQNYKQKNTEQNNSIIFKNKDGIVRVKNNDNVNIINPYAEQNNYERNRINFNVQSM